MILVVGEWLDQKILEAFSNANDSMILFHNSGTHPKELHQIVSLTGQSALQKSSMTVLLTLLITFPRIKNAVPETAFNLHITYKSFSIYKQNVQQGIVPSCVRKLSSTHTRNLLDCFLSAMLYFQQTSGKLKS